MTTESMMGYEKINILNIFLNKEKNWKRSTGESEEKEKGDAYTEWEREERRRPNLPTRVEFNKFCNLL